MKNAPIAKVLAVMFFTTSILFACLYLSEKHALQTGRAAVDADKKSEAKLKSSVQAAEASTKDRVPELAAEGREALSGIYYCQQVVSRNELDLRSDSSAVWINASSGQKLGTSKWTSDGDSLTVGTVKFKIEGSDLLDSRANRWLHIR
jgi:hypothetical protein